MKVILASTSPRRKEILERLPLIKKLILMKPDFEENLDKNHFQSPKNYVIANSRGKGLSVYQECQRSNMDDYDVIVSSDTVVVQDNLILEKPKDRDDATRMLNLLKNNRHFVFTAVTLIKRGKAADFVEHSFVETTEVFLGNIDKDLLEIYLSSTEPYDKAGGYGYQGIAAYFIKKIDGCFYNVVGFPAYKFLEESQRFLKE